MKKLIVLLFIMFLTIVVKAQLFITIEPAYFRTGIVYNHNFHKFGLYGKIWYGDIRKKIECDYFYTQNIKTGIGASFPIPDKAFFYIGINRSFFFDYTKNSTLNNIDNIIKTSFDLGISGKLTQKFSILFMSDLWNWESCIGLNFIL
jgi:hypothetical protein